MQLEVGQTATVYVAEIRRDMVEVTQSVARRTAKQVALERPRSRGWGWSTRFPAEKHFAFSPSEAVADLRAACASRKQHYLDMAEGMQDEIDLCDAWREPGAPDT